MDGFEAFVDAAVRFIRIANEEAADFDGRLAFVMGLLTWFLVEQTIRRLAGLLRVAIIVAAVGGAGIGAAALLAALDERPPDAHSH